MIPQILWLLLYFVGCCWVAHKHGQPRESWYFWGHFIGATIELLILWWGGFFDCFLK